MKQQQAKQAKSSSMGCTEFSERRKQMVVGWRLPDVKELQSINDYSRSPGMSNSAAIDPLFQLQRD